MQHNPTKVALSKYELELVTNAQILLTKNEIIKKVYELFGLLADDFVLQAQSILPVQVAEVPPKISRGENYEGLPYVMLDYPRYFKKEETFAIRTFFWWGNFFSITLQLSGKYKDIYLVSLQQKIQEGYFADSYLNVSDNQWDHHFREGNYKIIENAKDLENKSVIKLSTKIPLEKWDEVQIFLLESFARIIEVLKP